MAYNNKHKSIKTRDGKTTSKKTYYNLASGFLYSTTSHWNERRRRLWLRSRRKTVKEALMRTANLSWPIVPVSSRTSISPRVSESWIATPTFCSTIRYRFRTTQHLGIYKKNERVVTFLILEVGGDFIPFTWGGEEANIPRQVMWTEVGTRIFAPITISPISSPARLICSDSRTVVVSFFLLS